MNLCFFKTDNCHNGPKEDVLAWMIRNKRGKIRLVEILEPNFVQKYWLCLQLWLLLWIQDSLILRFDNLRHHFLGITASDSRQIIPRSGCGFMVVSMEVAMDSSNARYKARYGPLWHLRTHHDQVDGCTLSMMSKHFWRSQGMRTYWESTKRNCEKIDIHSEAWSWRCYSGSVQSGPLQNINVCGTSLQTSFRHQKRWSTTLVREHGSDCTVLVVLVVLKTPWNYIQSVSCFCNVGWGYDDDGNKNVANSGFD